MDVSKNEKTTVVSWAQATRRRHALPIGVQKMKRRYFLCLLCSLGIIPNSVQSRLPENENDRLQRIHDRILSLSIYPKSARKIIDMCQPGTHQSQSPTGLLHELVSKLGLSPTYLLRLNDFELLEALRIRITKDFEESQTISVDGWVMSQTEMLCCGLISLKAS